MVVGVGVADVVVLYDVYTCALVNIISDVGAVVFCIDIPSVWY